jgi:hypothetical protein
MGDKGYCCAAAQGIIAVCIARSGNRHVTLFPNTHTGTDFRYTTHASNKPRHKSPTSIFHRKRPLTVEPMEPQLLGVLLSALVSCFTNASWPLLSQKSSKDETFRPYHQKVPGDNSAYFTRGKGEDQLITVYDFTVSPYPPIPYCTYLVSFKGHQLNHSQQLPHLLLPRLRYHWPTPDLANCSVSPMRRSKSISESPSMKTVTMCTP